MNWKDNHKMKFHTSKDGLIRFKKIFKRQATAVVETWEIAAIKNDDGSDSERTALLKTDTRKCLDETMQDPKMAGPPNIIAALLLSPTMGMKYRISHVRSSINCPPPTIITNTNRQRLYVYRKLCTRVQFTGYQM